MADKIEKEELGSFLNKVDEIESIIKGMTSDDSSAQTSAMTKADTYLLKHGEKQVPCDRTSINVINNEKPVPNTTEGFMKAVEEDARRRANENKKRKLKADELKEKGNGCFKNEKYHEAIKFYTDAINEYKTNTALYTNRAQAFIKIRNFEEAITDCEMALKLDDKCVKAYVHKGRALQNMREFNKAIETFQEAAKVVPKQEKVLKVYLQAAETEQTKAIEEEKAAKVIQENNHQAVSIKTSVQTLLQSDHTLKHYTDTATTLANLLALSETNKTLFRTNSGFDIINNNSTAIGRYWDGSVVCQNNDEITCFSEVINVLKGALTDNDYNVEEFLAKDHSKTFIQLLHQPTSPVITNCILDLLNQLTQTSSGRIGIMSSCQQMQQILKALLGIVNTGSATAVIAMAIISNLAFELKFAEQFSGVLGQDFLKISKNMLLRLCKVCTKGLTADITVTWSLTRSVLSAMANMARNRTTRELITTNMDWWGACHKFMERYGKTTVIRNNSHVHDTVLSLLGLLTNISSQANQVNKNDCDWLMNTAKELLDCEDDDIVEHCVSFLRFLLSHSKVSLERALSDGLYMKFISLIKSSRPVIVRYALKCLALCTSTDERARQATFENQGIDSLVSLLSSNDEIVLGNAALCLGDCALNGVVCKHLVGTDIVQTLLKHATNDSLKQDVKRNAVLCLARLATGDQRHRDRLKDLHGLEILHSVFIKE